MRRGEYTDKSGREWALHAIPDHSDPEAPAWRAESLDVSGDVCGPCYTRAKLERAIDEAAARAGRSAPAQASALNYRRGPPPYQAGDLRGDPK